MIALMLMASSFTDSEYSCLNYYWEKDPLYQVLLGQEHAQFPINSDSLDYDSNAQFVDVMADDHLIRTSDNDASQIYALSYGQALNCMIGPDEAEFYRGSITHLSAKDIQRWSCAARVLRKISGFNAPQPEYDQDPFNMCKLLSAADNGSKYIHALVTYAPNLPKSNLGYGIRDSTVPDVLFDNVTYWPIHILRHRRALALLLICLPSMYGGIHLAAESFEFTSNIEYILWRSACMDIMITFPLVFLLLGIIFNLNLKVLRDFKVYVVTYHPRVPVTILSLVFLFYTVSRVYIFVEAFISLRRLPIEVDAVSP